MSTAIRLDSKANYWSIVMDSESSSHAEDRRKGHVIDQGPFLTGLLSVQVQAGRIDLLLMPDENTSGSPEFGLKSVGQLQNLIDEFRTLGQKLITHGPELQRLAFGSVLVNPVSSQEDGYRDLASLLKSVTVDPATSDFVYQVNRRIQSRVLPDWTINRLTKWLVLALNRIELPEPRKIGEPVFATRLELDINNSPKQNNVLSKDLLYEFSSELIDHGIAIARLGEIL